MSIDMTTSSVLENAQSLNKTNTLPDWNVPSRMAFHIVFTAKSGPKHPFIRRSYTDTSTPFNPNTSYKAHETRQILDDRMPAGVNYGIVTFEAGGSKDYRKEMRRTAEYLSRGWTSEGERFRCIYGHVPDDGFMLFVSADSRVYTPEDLGIYISSDAKAAKRARRFFAAHMLMVKGRAVDRLDLPTGTGYAVELTDGRLISVLDFDMSLLNKAQRALKEGSITCNLPGFDGTMSTIGGYLGQGKGVTHSNPHVHFDVVIYDSKKEFQFRDGTFYFGVLANTGLHPFKMDLQTLTNSGLYEDHLITKIGLDRMDELSELYYGDNEDAIIADFAATVRAVDTGESEDRPIWPLIRAVHLDYQSKTMPVLCRRMFSHGVEEAVDIVRGRVHLKNGMRAYTFPNPLMDGPDGMPDLSLDIISGRHEGLRIVCAPDAPEGRMVIGRSPNTNSSEMLELWNRHIPELMDHKGQGRVFFGADAGEILGQLNDGDMDDLLFAFWGEEFLAKFRQMRYPLEPLNNVRSSKTQSEHHHLNEKRWQGIGSKWTPNVFLNQLKDFERGSESLGSFINRGWIDTLLSGEHRSAIRACLNEGRYRLPENFNPPAFAALQKFVKPEILAGVNNYEPNEPGFVAVAKAFNDHKEDFVTRLAMSNSYVVIDWLQMKKGDKRTVDDLIANSMEALKTPIFPMCFASRIPKARREAGDYILVETKLCRALRILGARRDQLVEDNRQLEHLIKRPLSAELLRAYPVEERVIEIASWLKSWWARQFENARSKVTGVVPDDAFERAAYGYTELIDVQLPNGKTVKQEVFRPGLLDLYYNQFTPVGDTLEVTGGPWSEETRRKIGIHLANSRYTDNSEPRLDDDGFTISVADGILINEILHDILDAAEQLGITGQVEFINLNEYARKKLADGDRIAVKAINGHVFHVSNNRQLSQTPNLSLPDGSYMMSDKGIIRVQDSIPELKSNFLTRQVAANANGFTFDEDLEA
jgi:hypothetical protein